MRMKIFASFIIILCGVSKVDAVGSEHFTFMKKCLSSWENDQYSGLQATIKSLPDSSTTLIEYLDLNYHIRTKPIYDDMLLKLNQLEVAVANLYVNASYNYIAQESALNAIRSNREAIKFYFKMKSVLSQESAQNPTSIDEDFGSNSYDPNSQSVKQKIGLINDTILAEVVRFFILRNDVLTIIKNIGDDFLLSEDKNYPVDRNEKLPRDISQLDDNQLVTHIIKRYLDIKKIENNSRLFVSVNLSFNNSIGQTILIGGSDLDYMNSIITIKTNPINGIVQDYVQQIAPGWVLMLKRPVQKQTKQIP